MSLAVAIGAEGGCIFDCVLTVIGKRYAVMDLKIRRTILAAIKWCRLLAVFADSISACEDLSNDV